MSDRRDPSQTRSVWDEFHAGHGRQHFTPAFNGYLEAQIEDAGLEICWRVSALLLRSSWGNHSDCCLDENSREMTQTGFARVLNLFDAKGQPDRRKVNPIFRELEQRGYIRFEGQTIFPVDNPRGMPIIEAANVVPLSDIQEEKENKFSYFLEHIWGARYPIEFQQLMELERRHREIRTRILSEFKAYQQMSERVRQNGGQPSRKGSDSASERVRQADGEGPTSGAASLLLKTENLKTYSPNPSRSQSEKIDIRWRALLTAAEKARLTYGKGALDSLRDQFLRLQPEEREAAIQGVETRLNIGYYPEFASSLKRYLKEQLWTEQLRNTVERKPTENVDKERLRAIAATRAHT